MRPQTLAINYPPPSSFPFPHPLSLLHSALLPSSSSPACSPALTALRSLSPLPPLPRLLLFSRLFPLLLHLLLLLPSGCCLSLQGAVEPKSSPHLPPDSHRSRLLTHIHSHTYIQLLVLHVTVQFRPCGLEFECSQFVILIVCSSGTTALPFWRSFLVHVAG